MRRTSPRGLLFTVYGPELNTFSGEDISVRTLVGVSSREIWMAVGGYTDGGTLFFLLKTTLFFLLKTKPQKTGRITETPGCAGSGGISASTPDTCRT